MDAQGDIEQAFAAGVPTYATATVVFRDASGRIVGYGHITRTDSGAEVSTFPPDQVDPVPSLARQRTGG